MLRKTKGGGNPGLRVSTPPGVRRAPSATEPWARRRGGGGAPGAYRASAGQPHMASGTSPTVDAASDLPPLHPPPCVHPLQPPAASNSSIHLLHPAPEPPQCTHLLQPPPASTSCIMRVILHMARGEGSPESNLFWRRPGTVLFLRGAAPGPAVARPRPYTLLPPREATGPRRASAWWSWSAQAPTIQAGATRGRSGACTAVDALPAKWLASFTSREASRKRGLQAGRGTRVSRLRRLC